MSDGFRELAACVGEEHATFDPVACASVGRATYPVASRVLGVVCPASREEVRTCVRIAAKHSLRLSPLSRGRNWGYGSRAPAQDSVILDLRRMNRIVDFDEELGYLTVEPGVTFAQAFAFLRERGSRRFLNVTGAASDASVLANSIERGIGKGPYGDRFTAVADLEVVLGTGEVLEPGFGRFEEARARRVARWAVGPYLDGLFSQSSFGIVTRMTLFLATKPEHFMTFSCTLHEDDKLAPTVDALRRLRMSGLLRTPVLLANDHRVFSFMTRYPWEEAQGATPLPEDARRALRRRLRRGAWTGDAALYPPTAAHAAADRAAIEAALSPIVDELEFWDEEKAARADEEARLLLQSTGRDIRHHVDRAFRKSLYAGVPIEGSATMTYWRKRGPVPAELDPDRDGCGLLWYAPALPATGEDVRRALAIVEPIATRFGFEPGVGLNFVTERLIDFTGSILYDREIPGEDERALACHAELLTRLAEAGYHPYRRGLHPEAPAAPSAPAYRAVVGRIREALDPEGVLALGRYDEEAPGGEAGS